MSTNRKDFQILISCPTTGEQVLGENVRHFSVREQKGMWWHCPSCQGWHVMVYEGEKEAGQEYSPRINQLCLTAA